jgi:hypothetical protein
MYYLSTIINHLFVLLSISYNVSSYIVAIYIIKYLHVVIFLTSL